MKAMLVTACLFPVTSFAIAFVLNFIAIAYNSLAAIPFLTMVIFKFEITYFTGCRSFYLAAHFSSIDHAWNYGGTALEWNSR